MRRFVAGRAGESDVGAPPAEVASEPFAGLSNESLARTLATPKAPSRSFLMGGEHHTLSLQTIGGRSTIVMASTPEEVMKKIHRFENTIRRYVERLSQADVATRAAAFLQRLRELRTKVQTEVGTVALGPVKPAPPTGATGGATTATVPAVDYRALSSTADRHFSALDTIIKDLQDFARTSGISSLDPANIERWSHEQFMKRTVEPKQREVEDVLKRGVERVKALLGNDAEIKYRGSLARGLRSQRKLDKHGGVQEFNPREFDADAFIEVGAATWKRITTAMGGDGKFGLLAIKKAATQYADDLARAREQPELVSDLRDLARIMGEVVAVERDLRAGLTRIPGYKLKNRVADFYFIVQPARKSAGQLSFGTDYQRGALSQAGFRRAEQLGKDTRHPNKVFSAEKHRTVRATGGGVTHSTRDMVV